MLTLLPNLDWRVDLYLYRFVLPFLLITSFNQYLSLISKTFQKFLDLEPGYYSFQRIGEFLRNLIPTFLFPKPQLFQEFIKGGLIPSLLRDYPFLNSLPISFLNWVPFNWGISGII